MEIFTVVMFSNFTVLLVDNDIKKKNLYKIFPKNNVPVQNHEHLSFSSCGS